MRKILIAVVESMKDTIINDPRTKRTISSIMLGYGVVGLLWFIESGNELKALKGE